MIRPSRSVWRAVLAVALPLFPLAAACDGDAAPVVTGSATAVGSPDSADTISPSSSSPPYLVYSPPPPPDGPITTGYLGETLTLDVGDGQALRLTFHSTAMNAVAATVDAPRHFSVWLTVENPSDAPWRGNLGPLAHVVDDLGGDVVADPSPGPGDLSAAAAHLGYSNHSLAKTISIPPGGSVDGVLLFQMYGGNRVVSITIDSPSGGTPIAWETNFGVF